MGDVRKTTMRWLVLAVALSGCFTELLGEPDVTTRNVACRGLHGELASEVTVLIQQAPNVTVDLQPAAHHFLDELTNITGRDPGKTRVLTRLVNEISLSSDVFTSRGITLHVLHVADADEAVRVEAPGFIVIAASHYEAAAARTNQSVLDVATGALMHGMGHLLGVVNAGIPMNNTDPSRELPGNHEAGGIMRPAWHHGDTIPAIASLRYSDAVRADWQNAKGVCL